MKRGLNDRTIRGILSPESAKEPAARPVLTIITVMKSDSSRLRLTKFEVETPKKKGPFGKHEDALRVEKHISKLSHYSL